MRTLLTLLALTAMPFAGLAGTTPAPNGAYTYIISPKPGEVVSSPITVVFGASGIGIAPAGVQKENTGHHHLLVDTVVPDVSIPIPSDANHIHFGGGHTQTVIELAPGIHTLQLLMGDYLHVPHNPPLASEIITITVE